MVLAKTNSFRIKYKFVQQTLNVYKANLIALKMIIMSNFYKHILKKYRILLKL